MGIFEDGHFRCLIPCCFLGAENIIEEALSEDLLNDC